MINKISDNLFGVDNNQVKIQKKKGRKILLCSCENSSRFSNNNFCYHKELVLRHIILEPVNKAVDKLLNDYLGFMNIKGRLEPYSFVNDLKNLKRLIKLNFPQEISTRKIPNKNAKFN